MAQFAFARLDDIGPGNTGTLSITFIIRVVWVGDELAGSDLLSVVASRGSTQAQLKTAVDNAIIARAAEIGRPGLTAADIRYIGGSLF